MRFLEFIIPLLLLYIFYVKVHRGSKDLSYITSSIDGKEYYVRNLPDKQKAADTLATLRKNLTTLVNTLYNRRNEYAEFKTAIERLKHRFQTDKISEGAYDAKNTSYTINKSNIVFCLRSKTTDQQLHQINLLMFIAIHEMGHIMSVSLDHTEEFKKNFTFLLQQAVKFGLYKPTDFRKYPTTYCGVEITDTPLDL